MSFFRARTNATQNISSSVLTQINFGAELSDPDGAFASNLFTVPASWNGRVGGLTAGEKSTTVENYIAIFIERQTGGTGPFVPIARNYLRNEDACTVSAYPVLFQTGDVYRVVFLGSATTVANDPACFFSGWVMPAATKLGMFRATVNATQAVSASTLTPVTFGVEEVDSHAVFTSNEVTVPADFNGGFLHLTAGMKTEVLSNEAKLEIQVSTDGGTTWTDIAQMSTHLAFSRYTVDSGPIAAVTGHKYRVAVFFTSAFTISNSPEVFFSGALFKY